MFTVVRTSNLRQNKNIGRKVDSWKPELQDSNDNSSDIDLDAGDDSDTE
jgi:hypothetical protein